MANKLKCSICKKVFYGPKNKMYCGSRDCHNAATRKKRKKRTNEENIEKRRKEANRKHYLKNKYPLTKKYKLEQEKNKLEQEKKKKREEEVSKIWRLSNKEKSAEYRRKTKEKNRKWFDGYKKTLKCEICGYIFCLRKTPLLAVGMNQTLSQPKADEYVQVL